MVLFLMNLCTWSGMKAFPTTLPVIQSNTHWPTFTAKLGESHCPRLIATCGCTQAESQPILRYEDLDSREGLIMFQGHIEKYGPVHLEKSEISLVTAGPQELTGRFRDAVAARFNLDLSEVIELRFTGGSDGTIRGISRARKRGAIGRGASVSPPGYGSWH